MMLVDRQINQNSTKTRYSTYIGQIIPGFSNLHNSPNSNGTGIIIDSGAIYHTFTCVQLSNVRT